MRHQAGPQVSCGMGLIRGIPAALVSVALGGCSAIAPLRPSIPSPSYTLAWHDEFDGTKLDESKWTHYAPGPRRDAVNLPEAVTLDGKGHLVITTSRVDVPDPKNPGATRPEYHTGMI